jgi:hypothetical protein
MRLISKSRYLQGRQCSKLFWTQYNDKEKIPPTDAATQAIFDQGHDVGHLAKSLYPGGVEIEGDPWKFADLMARTREAMKKRVPLYEAAFGGRNAFARADILVPAEDGAWDIVEVKSSTQVKPVNILDLSLQRYAAESNGLKIGKCVLMHVDTSYVRHGALELEKLFAREDVTAAVAEEFKNVESNLEEMLAVLRLDMAPDVPIGPRCDDPYTCALHDVCWEFLPENSPLKLTGFPKVDAFELIRGGLLKLEEISDEIDLTGKQDIQVKSARTGSHHIDAKKIREFLKQLSYPRYYLDFETFQTAVPEFDDTRPYQQVPFQFSLHVAAAPGAALAHQSYLSEGKIDPRPEFLALLRDRLGEAGPIICYNAAFERGIVAAAVEVVPDFKDWWKKTKKRFVDLLVPFRAFAYYHPDQLGSASLKAVLPALTGGPGYEGLEICDGGMASWEYRRVTFGKVDPAERARIRKQLEEYCGLDTEAMIRIVAALEALELPAETAKPRMGGKAAKTKTKKKIKKGIEKSVADSR